MPRRAMNRCSRFKAIPRLSSPDRECFGFFRCGQLSWTGRCVACTVSPPNHRPGKAAGEPWADARIPSQSCSALHSPCPAG